MRQLGFEGYRIDRRTRQLLAPSGEPVALSGKAFEVLLHLVEHHGQMVTKDELLAAVWPGRVIEENTLTQAISLVRRALGSNAGDHRYIVTMPGRGYRFVAEVSEDASALPQQRRASDGVAPDVPDIAPTTAVADTAIAEPATLKPSSHRRAWLLGGALCLLALLALAAWRGRRPDVSSVASGAPRANAARTRLAVLPFRSLTGGPRDEGLELGLAETLITRLSRSPDLQVAALTSAQRVPAPVAAEAAGRQLGAAYVVEGTTQRVGEQVRVNARLISVDKGVAVWAGTFDADIGRVFTLQDKMGDAVTSALALAPAVASPRPQSPCDGADALAYRAYLRGYYKINRPSAVNLAEALAAFREAIDRDPTCARAWAGTAFAYRGLVITGDRDPKALFPLAKAAVARALAIDPDSAEAYASKGFIEFWYDWNWPQAEASLRHAIALNPNLAESQIALAHLLVNIGRAPEAVPYARRAVALDPLSPIVNALAGSFLVSAGQVEEGQAQLQKTLELEPDAWQALRVTSARAQKRGDKAGALGAMRRAVEISGGHSNTLAGLGRLYAEYGDRPAAERVLAELEARRRKGYLPATSLAVAEHALGDTERALDLLELGYRERDVRMSFLLRDWPDLRGQPRYQALLQRMHLPDTPTNRKASPEAR